ncbi:uncharacterized protein [Eurosta solidaginis]|uniref:uncharacterized protein n=1 Tax=Eurosta solidaginis TaxID=178769 RepID=UPI003530A34B
MTEFKPNYQRYSHADSALKLKRSGNEVSCTPLWMYKIGDAMSDLLSTDQLPIGYATSVGYGERFRDHEFLPLFSCYPFVPFLIALGCFITLGGITFALYRWRTGTRLHHYLNCKISKDKLKYFYVNYILVVIICIGLTFAITMMLIAHNNISEEKKENALNFELADRNIEKIINNKEYTNFGDPLNNFKQISEKLLRAIEMKVEPNLRETSQKTDLQDFMMYRDDIKDLLNTFDHANRYMLHFLDSWRYYDTNATKFAKAVATMDSHRALRALQQVRMEFANVVYKVIQQNRAFYNYYQQLESLAKDDSAKYAPEYNKKLLLTNTLNIHMKNVEDRLERLGNKLQDGTIEMKETKENFQKAADDVGYIEFPATLLGFGYFISASMLLIVFLSLSFMPLWVSAKYSYRIAFFRGILPLIILALIFAFYLIFVLAIMYYFLYGMVAKDGICEEKGAITSARSNLIDDCLNKSNTFDANIHSHYYKDMTEIEKVLKEIENISKRRVIGYATSQPLNDFETYRVNKTIIQDIYVEMLKVSVYAPKNIEGFGLIWNSNRLSTNKILQQLNCTHAIGNTMATSLHGQVAHEMDKLYRTTWRIEAMLQDLPKQLNENSRNVPKNPSAATNITDDLQTIFNADKEELQASLYNARNALFEDCKDLAQVFKSLTMRSCKCLMRSLNLFWSGAVVSVFILLLLLVLLIWLVEMLRRSYTPIGKSSRRRNASKTREKFRTRSTSRPSSIAHSSRTNTSYSTRDGTPISTRRNTPYSTRANTPQTSRSRNTAQSSRPDTPYSSHRVTPYSSERSTTHISHTQADASYFSKQVTPRSISTRSSERTPTRGTGLAQKLPPIFDPYFNDYIGGSVHQDYLADRFTERLSRRDVLPRYQQRKLHYPCLGHRDKTYETYPELPSIAHQTQQPTLNASVKQTHESSYEPKSMRKKNTFRYPGFAGSDFSTIHPGDIPRSISKVIERRGRSLPNETHERNANDDKQPSSSGLNAEVPPLQPGKVGIILCPCGCGKPSKIYGTKDDIERIRKAGRICIAKRGEHLRNKHLKSFTSVMQLRSDDPDEDNV